MKKLVMLPLSALAGISMLFGPRAALSAEVPCLLYTSPSPRDN